MNAAHIPCTYDTNLQGCRVNSLLSGCICRRAIPALYVTMFPNRTLGYARDQRLCLWMLKTDAYSHYDLISNISYSVSYHNTTPFASLTPSKCCILFDTKMTSLPWTHPWTQHGSTSILLWVGPLKTYPEIVRKISNS
jgi:hypothetical protein